MNKNPLAMPNYEQPDIMEAINLVDEHEEITMIIEDLEKWPEFQDEVRALRYEERLLRIRLTCLKVAFLSSFEKEKALAATRAEHKSTYMIV